jgi:D-beta-D-heptose 7-phosphate kinase/D-beta-D-heptose 1-phosphate adenosyltransferase
MTADTPQTRTERIEEIIHSFRGRRILVAGDLILDRYLWGDVERTSPEAPVPVVKLRDRTTGLGGAANVVSNLTALGARPSVIGVLGDDEEALAFRQHLRELGVGAAGLLVDRERPTTVKTRVMALGQQLIRLDSEATEPLPRALQQRLLKRFRKALSAAEVVVLSDYDKGVLAGGVCEKMISLARRAKKTVVVDPKGIDYRKYKGATVIKPNRKEARAAAGVEIDSLESLGRAARVLLRQTGAEAIVVSRSGEGASVYQRRHAATHISSQARDVYDEAGCGDSFVAAMSLALAAGASFADATRLGNAAGSVVVGKLGVADVEPHELLQALQPGGATHKLRSGAQMAREIEARRAAGKRVVLTNGCFDLIHLGHIKFLEQARRLGDALAVAINSDRSVRALKGPPRPVLGEEERISILASLDTVDYIVVFDEKTPERLLRQVRPDILVKGKDLAPEEIVGREIVEAYGGKVVSLPQLGEVTTDAVVERIARRTAGRSSIPKK